MAEPHRFNAAVCTFSATLRAFSATLCALLLCGLATGAELDRHAVTVDGHTFAVWSKTAVVSESTRPVMLLIHGRTWSTRPDFDLQVPGEELSLMDGLVGQGIDVYGVDLRGYGATPRDETGWLTPDRAAADVAGILEWIRSRHEERPYLFGWSNGALVSQLVAQRHGGAIGGLILFGYPLRHGMAPGPTASEPLRAATTAEAAASDFLLPGTISQAAIDVFVDAALAADPIRADWRALDEWLALDAAAVSQPTLLLQGEHDPLADPSVHGELFAGLGSPDKAWVVIPGGDHAAFMETPRSYFLSAIESFVHRGSPGR